MSQRLELLAQYVYFECGRSDKLSFLLTKSLSKSLPNILIESTASWSIKICGLVALGSISRKCFNLYYQHSQVFLSKENHRNPLSRIYMTACSIIPRNTNFYCAVALRYPRHSYSRCRRRYERGIVRAAVYYDEAVASPQAAVAGTSRTSAWQRPTARSITEQ